MKQDWDFQTCELCSYRCKSSFALGKHENLHETRLKTDVFTCYSKPPELYPCEFCGFETNLKVDLTEHVRIFHEGKEEEKELKKILKCFRCKNCDFETHSVLVLTNHTDECYSHKLEDEGCLKTNILLEHSYSISVKQHITWNGTNNWFKRNLILNNASSNELKCRQCGYQFKSAYNLKEHVRLLHAAPADIKWLQCDQCEYKCKRKNNLTRHIKNRHITAEYLKWFKCNKCEYKCKLECRLKQHISSTHTNEEVWLQCEQCAFQSKHKKHLELHMAVHENPAGIKWFLQCALCEFICCKPGTTSRLHFSRKHAINVKDANGFKPERNASTYLEHGGPIVVYPKDLCWFRCAQCHYKCKRKVNVKKHISKEHSAQNPKTTFWFKCTECSFKSKFEDCLKMHQMLREHLNLEDEDASWVQCTQCVFKTRDKLALKMHILHDHFI